MKKNLILLIAIIMVVVSLPSCSEEDSPTNGSSDITNYFPMILNAWWKYENHVIDSETNQPTGEAEYDSMAVTKNDAVKLDSTAYEFTTWDIVNGQAENPTMDYFYKEGKKLWAFSDLINSQLDLGVELPLPLELEDMWVLVADPDGTQWKIYEKDIPKTTIDLDGNEAEFTGTFEITNTNAGTEDIEIGGDTFSARKYRIAFNILGNAVPLAFPVPIAVTMKTVYSVWFVEDIGLVKTYLEPVVITVAGEIASTFDGSQSVLMEHYIPE